MNPVFSVDSFGFVVAKLENGGELKSQTVEALLLYAILQVLLRETTLQYIGG